MEKGFSQDCVRCISRPGKGNATDVARVPSIRGDEFLHCKDLYRCKRQNAALSVRSLASKLLEIEREMDNLPGELNQAYFIALEEEIKQHTHYVRSKKFLLAFLKAENFDASKAAFRMAKFFEHKLELFGPAKLPHRIVQDDLNEDDRLVLSSGFPHYGGMDCEGRLVFSTHRDRLLMFGLLKERFVPSTLRSCLYMCMSAIEECMENQCETQALEVVVIRWGLNNSMPLKDYRTLFVPLIKMLFQAVPFRVVTVHSCISNPIERMCVTWVESFSQRFSEHQTRAYGPSHTECLAELSHHGIDIDTFPVTADGDFNLELHEKTLNQMRQNERKGIQKNSVDVEEKNKIMIQVAPIEDLASSKVEASENVDESLGPTSQSLGDNLPMKLRELMELNTNSDAMRWSRDGTAFEIEKNRFPETVLLKEFSGIQMSSFIRRLKRWGFKRSFSKKGSTTNWIEYHHPLFQKSSPELMRDWGMTVREKLPLRMRKILNNETFSDIFWWVDDGKAFAITKSKYSCNAVATHFGALKFDSLHRMLNRWGFKRLLNHDETIKNSDVIVYQHMMFQKDLQLSSEIVENWDSLDGFTQLSKRKQGSRKKDENFVKKLYRILESEMATNAIWWEPSGNAFWIDKIKFSQNVLLTEYNGIKLSSFYRNLKRWGFDKKESIGGMSLFQHPSFRKNFPELSNKRNDEVRSNYAELLNVKADVSDNIVAEKQAMTL